MSQCALCKRRTRFGAHHCDRCWALLNGDGTALELEKSRNEAVHDPQIVGADQPLFRTFIWVSLPALCYYPSLAIIEHAPSGALRELAQLAAITVFATPLIVMPMAWMAWRYAPASRLKWFAAWSLTLFTAAMAVQCIPLISHLLGIA